MEYRADVRDVKFNLFEWLELDALLKTELFGDFGREDLDMIVDEALKVCKGELANSNDVGDRVGLKHEDQKVITPPEFKKAYADMVDGGWTGATANPEFGGMGLPETVGTAINEYITGANVSLSLTLLLTRGSAHLIENFGTDEMKALYCEKMYTGEWAGTMCMTEPSAGSDLGDIKTKATRIEGNRYKLTGEKIFITSGDQDLTDNIVHAVLARTPEAPVGAKGLSLFIVPKVRVNPDGSLGESNDVVCEKIEEKLGIHGSPTCTLLFGPNDGCEGYLLAKERMGLPLMFQMMNTARYEVGLQGVAVGSAAFQAALSFARERLQGRSYRNREHTASQIPIVEHPDVRRMLLHQSAIIQAMRGLLYYTAWCMDMTRITEGEEKQFHQGMVELLTPICKAWCSDRGLEVTNLALQCHGGYGYINEYPAEQYWRDARIAAIYEGTNGIQALDLVGRKFRMKGGSYLKNFLGVVGKTAQQHGGHEILGPAARRLGANIKEVSELLMGVASRDDAMILTLLNAYPVLDIFGDLFGGHILIDQAANAHGKLQTLLEEKGVDAGNPEALEAFFADNEDAAFYNNKIQAALYWDRRVMPFISARAVSIREADLSPLKASF